MYSLKHEMRRKFDEKSRGASGDSLGSLEEGLLEKILNLSISNLYTFEPVQWQMVAVKSSTGKYKLYSLAGNDPDLYGSCVTLIILENPESRHHIDLLAMSIMYAAKYYGVEFHQTQHFDREGICREFGIAAPLQPALLIGLGYFSSTQPIYAQPYRYSGWTIVREI